MNNNNESCTQSAPPRIDRRRFMAYFSTAGLTTTLLPGILWARLADASESTITKEMVAEAEKIAALEFSDEERETIARGLNRATKNFIELRNVPIPNDLPPAFQFNPVLPGTQLEQEQRPLRFTEIPVARVPENLEELAFWPVAKLSTAFRERKVTSTALTKMYLARLKRYDPLLKCVITLTEERALKQAAQADTEIAQGKYRGPLHGIPWGAKDLLAAKGYETTWGAMPYKDQIFDEDATVVTRLDEAGAVLIAKLTLGALAQGDVWYGGRTNSPWNLKRGSSGSSAGPASATAAGLVPFAIGSETNGSITSPSTVCGVTGLRPTFGRVSRHGAMALSWTMDKLGPICRTVEDCAIVLDAIRGSDDKDPTAIDVPFNWNPDTDLDQLRIGYLKDAFNTNPEQKGNNEKTLDTLRALRVDLIPVELPQLPVNAMSFILGVEAAAAFDDLTRSNRDDLLVSQSGLSWPNAFRTSRFVPAVEYIQANRVRTLLMREMAQVMSKVDCYVTPTMRNLYLGNFTGHPIISVPNGFSSRGEPTSIGFFGGLYREAELLAVAKAYQDATDFHLKHPELNP